MELLKEEICIKKIPIKELNQETFLYYCYTDKFKTFYTSCTFLFDYDEKIRPVNILLAYLLNRTTGIHKVEEDFIGYLYNLYDMLHNVSHSQLGLIDYITFRTGTVNSKYIHENVNLLKESISLLKESIFFPNFDVDIFNEIKESLIENIINRQNNKINVAYDHFFDSMFKNELINSKVIRDPKVYESITLDDVKNAYDELLKCPHVYYYIGEDKEEDVIKYFSGFDFPISKTCCLKMVDDETKVIEKEQIVIEEFEVSQSNIIMGYRTDILSNHQNYYAMHVLNLMIGDYSNSELFRIIREENGLSYNISSMYNPDKGYMVIRGGISKENFDKTYNLITEIINKYKLGNILEENLELTKRIVITAIKSGLDTFTSTYNASIAYALKGSIRTSKEQIDLINALTIDDIKKAANSLVLDTVFFMKGVK